MNDNNVKIEALGVYFVDRFNFPALHDCAKRGDELSQILMGSIMTFLQAAPPTICSICSNHVTSNKSPSPYKDDMSDMSIVIMHYNQSTLTTWVCEECSIRDDLDAEVEKIIREWPAIDKTAKIEIIKDHRLH